MDFLRHSLAPVTDAAWAYLATEARRILVANLTARRFVEVVGPKGFEFSSVNLGTLSNLEQTSDDEVTFGVRQVLPLVEVRVPLRLNLWALDDLSRGAAHVDARGLTEACSKLVRLEDRAIYLGFPSGRIQGIAPSAVHDPIRIGDDPASYPDAVAKAVIELNDAGVAGPFAMVLGPRWFRVLSGELSPYPPRKRIEQIIGGPVLYSPVLEGGLLASMRGGDFELTVGQDPSIGYTSYDGTDVHLYLTETFTFRVLGPEAAVVFSSGA